MRFVRSTRCARRLRRLELSTCLASRRRRARPIFYNRTHPEGMLFSFHTFKRISTLFSRHFAISSRPGLALSQDIVDMVGLYNIYTDTEPPRARPGPSRPSSSSGGPPAAARCGGVTNPTAEHRDAVGRSKAQ